MFPSGLAHYVPTNQSDVRRMILSANIGHVKVPHELQLHLTHSCNLTCEGYHYMNQGHSGKVSLETTSNGMTTGIKEFYQKDYSDGW